MAANALGLWLLRFIFLISAQREKYDRFGDDEELEGDVDMEAFMAMFGHKF